MTKNEMENETNNKNTGINQGKGSGLNAGTGAGTGAGSAKETGSSAAKSEGNSSTMSGGSSSTSNMGMNKTPGQDKNTAPGSGKTGDAGGVLGQVQESGKDLASKSLSAISERTRSATEGYKTEITGGLHTLAEGLRQTSSTFKRESNDTPLASAGGRYLGDLADKIESVSSYFERKDATALMRDVKGFAKRNPTVFVGGAFALGFALSRLIRSSGSASSTRSNGGPSSMRG